MREFVQPFNSENRGINDLYKMTPCDITSSSLIITRLSEINKTTAQI